MNTEDEKRDKMLESFNVEAKNSVLSRWLTTPAPHSKQKKFLTLAGLFNKIKKRFNKAKPPSPLPKLPRYRVTRAPTENVHHLIDVSPMPNALSDETLQSTLRKAKYVTNRTCLCRSKFVTVWILRICTNRLARTRWTHPKNRIPSKQNYAIS